jgi:outer membrane receptor protein involved in Fe transport
LVDFLLSYQYKSWQVAGSIENLLNSAWKEAQFATESKLQNEPNPVNEIHFTPGTPRFAKLSLTYSF